MPVLGGISDSQRGPREGAGLSAPTAIEAGIAKTVGELHMNGQFRIYGSEMSPYSHKVRSWFRYKQIDHAWIPSGPGADVPEYKRLAKLPIVPLVVYPDGETAAQDSTPIIEALERDHPEPSIQPPGAVLGFLSCLVEEFGDEWGNKLMFHLRWYADVDLQASSLRAARLNLVEGTEDDVAARAERIRSRMEGRRHFVGSSDQTAPLIFSYYNELLDLLELHLERRPYLFGERPSFGDFGLAAQIYHAASDPTGGSLVRARAPSVLEWSYRMIDPRADGDFEPWTSLRPTMMPILSYVGRYFLPWSDANARALMNGDPEFTVMLAGRPYIQPPQKYHAKSLAALREKFRAVADDRELRAILVEAGCLDLLEVDGSNEDD